MRQFNTPVIVMLVLWIVSCSKSSEREITLPIINSNDVPPELVDRTWSNNDQEHKIPEFSFENQDGIIITRNDLLGKITIVSFFFTTCPMICPTITKNLTKVQNAYLMDESILLLSHTVHPEYDSISILKKYSKDYNILSTKWNLVRGVKIDINNIAKRGYFAVNQDITGDFIHTENVVLVDWEYRIRGIYNGTSSISIEQLIGDIKILKNEMNRLL